MNQAHAFLELPAECQTNSSNRWLGTIDGTDTNLIFGWAFDTEEPDRRVVLEVSFNDDIVGCVIADIARSDIVTKLPSNLINTGLADCCHGFVADVGEYINAPDSSISIRVANTSVELARVATSNKNDVILPLACHSDVYGDGGLRIHGWMLDPLVPTKNFDVIAMLGNRELARTKASLPTPHLRGTASEDHGFILDLPLSLADGHLHEVRIIDQNGDALNGSPITVCCHKDGVSSFLACAIDNPLLSNVTDTYEQHLPRSVGQQLYSEWKAEFELSPAETGALLATSRSHAVVRVGVLIVHAQEGSALRSQATRESLLQQRGVELEIVEFDECHADHTSLSNLLRTLTQTGIKFISVIRAGDQCLSVNAINLALQGFEFNDAQIVYGDSEFEGKPWFKPAWNPEYALSSDYPLDFMLFRSEVIINSLQNGEKIRDSADLAWTVLSMAWESGMQSIIHVPRILSRRNSPYTVREQRNRFEAAVRCLQRKEPETMLELLSLTADQAHFATRRIRRALPSWIAQARVSLLIPTRDQVDLLRACIESIRKFTTWPNLEIVIMDNGSVKDETKAYFCFLEKEGYKVLHMPGPFNFSDINNRAVQAASGEIIGLLNNDVEAMHSGWLEEILSHLGQPNVGAVGAKLLWTNAMVQHGGVVLGLGNVAGHYGNWLSDQDWGDHGRNQLLQQMSAVTAACLFIRKQDYISCGGMDAKAFPIAFNDVDLCLKLRQAGKAIIWTPFAKLLHAESASRGREDTPQKQSRAKREIAFLRQRWGASLLRDPAYHPALNLDAHSLAFNGLALPPRDRSPRKGSFPGETS